MSRDVQQMLDALSSPIRREIIWLIRDVERPAGEIAEAFEVGAPTVSQHLAILREAGLIEMRVDGNFRRYRANAAALVGLEPLLASDDRWTTASELPEVKHASVTATLVCCVVVEIPAPPEVVFNGFVDPVEYSRWVGVPVSIVDGRFACTLEFGTHIRGTYDVIVSPSLLAMRWDFDDGNVPVPGDERIAYLRIWPTPGGSRVEIHQFAADQREVEFMNVAWSMMLGRLVESFGEAPPPKRARRSK
jgi:DNA-binding transcriptional ArsR family regulator/uncharacterized protein YndB with AHSA1/START domain